MLLMGKCNFNDFCLKDPAYSQWIAMNLLTCTLQNAGHERHKSCKWGCGRIEILNFFYVQILFV